MHRINFLKRSQDRIRLLTDDLHSNCKIVGKSFIFRFVCNMEKISLSKQKFFNAYLSINNFLCEIVFFFDGSDFENF